MAKKKITLETLAAQIEKGFAAVANDFADIRKEMATKKDIVKINETLAEHTRDLNIIKNDVKTNLDRRLTLEVRVTNIEKKVFGASQEPAHQ